MEATAPPVDLVRVDGGIDLAGWVLRNDVSGVVTLDIWSPYHNETAGSR
jgi:hypothetical protein